MKIHCPCGGIIHDSETIGRLVYFDDMPKEMRESINKVTLETYQQIKPPFNAMNDIEHIFMKETSQVWKCADCGRICYDEDHNDEENFKLKWFKPEDASRTRG